MTGSLSNDPHSAILDKQRGNDLSRDRMRAVIDGFLGGEVDAAEMEGFLRAVARHGTTADETFYLTAAMRDSCRKLGFPEDDRPLVDRHSTGGVGDPSTMIFAPLLASIGARCPSISTRGAGTLGGTVDKLESVPDIDVLLPPERLVTLVQRTGCAICDTSEELDPADHAIFELRARTGTMACIPLMVSSILSKKAVAGIETLAVDIKYGPGMLLRDVEEADLFERLARSVAEKLDIKLIGLLSEAHAPASRSIGAWLEITAATDYLSGRRSRALDERISRTAGSVAVACGLARDQREAWRAAVSAIESGEALARWRAMLAGQSANLAAFDEKLARGVVGDVVETVAATTSGYVQRCDPDKIGTAARLLESAAGDHAAGIDCLLLPGDACSAGGTLARILAPTTALASEASDLVADAFHLGDVPPAPRPFEVRHARER